MNAPTIDPPGDTATRQQLLVLARHLDRFGRHAEEFLSQQLEQLELAIDDFEREKAAWRRQLKREARQLASLRESMEQLDGSASAAAGPGFAATKLSREQAESAEAIARKSGAAPIRLLLQPQAASPQQAGLLLFEVSKLNRDMGGLGLHFEMGDVRKPGKRLWTRHAAARSSGDILEVIGFSAQPLASRGTHVELDVDVTDRIERWIAFKARLLRSSLVNGELTTVFCRARSVTLDHDARGFLREATRRVDEAASKHLEAVGYSSQALFGTSALNSVARQVERLEGSYERLMDACGLRVDIEVLTGP